MYSAGISRIDVTPPLGYRLQGHGSRTRPAEKVHDPLMLKIMTVYDGTKRLAIVTADLVYYSVELVEEVRQRAQQELGIAPECLLMAASHTHTGPHMVADHPIGTGTIPDYISLLVKKIIGGIRAAMNDEEPVTFHWGKGAVDVSINRRKKTPQGIMFQPDPDGPVDRETGVLRVNRADDSPKGIIFTFACHPTSIDIHDKYEMISADYPGAAQMDIEKMYPHASALFINGCGGDVKPADPTRTRFAESEFNDPELRIPGRIGRILAAEVIKVSEQSRPVAGTNVAGVLKKIGLPLNSKLLPDNLRRLDELYAHYKKQYGVNGEHLNFWKQAMASKLNNNETIPSKLEIDLQAVRIGGFVILGLDGEVMVEIGLEIKKRILKESFVCAYVNGGIGYVPTAQALRDGGYEPYTFMLFKYPAPYSEDMEECLTLEAAKIVKEVVSA